MDHVERPSRLKAALILALGALIVLGVVRTSAETADPNGDNSQYAWGENVGWLNAEPSADGGPGMTVSGASLTGYMYGENIGWINLNCTNNGTCGSTGNYGVTNDGTGKLGGYAWGENVGWISFSCANNPSTCASTGNYGVVIDPATGIFSGYAYGENIGFISFNCSNTSTCGTASYKVQTDDGDAIAGNIDNCPFDASGTQKNTDFEPLVSPPVPASPNDTTIANSDKLGDACDADADNDGLLNTVETGLGPGHASHTLCLTASADTDPLKSDTDGDRVLDSAECAMGSDPANVASKPPIPSVANDTDRDGLSDVFEIEKGTDPTKRDTDADKIPDGVEYKGYNTDPNSTDTDGDLCADGRETASVNTDTRVDSLDLLVVARLFNRHDFPVQDINKDGVVNSADLAMVAANFNSVACPAPP
jgi:hypothetical protein